MIMLFFFFLQAHQILQNFEDAIAAFQKVINLEPSNKAARNQLLQTRNKVKQLRERERKRYANMFEKLSAGDQEEAKK